MQNYESRNAIPEKYRWNLSLMYPNFDLWEQDFKKIDSLAERVLTFKGKLVQSAQVLKSAFEAQAELDLLIEKLYSYSHHLSDEDTRNSDHLGRQDRIRSKATEVMAKLSWIEPELLEAPVSVLNQFQKEPVLKDYDRRLETLLRSKPHQRSAEVEEVLSLASEPLSASYKAFSLLENADFIPPKVKDGKGEEREVNHATYGSCMESSDRTLRKNSYEAYFAEFAKFKNTYAATLDGNVKKQIFGARVRNFNSAIEASLFSDQIPLSVYNGLISTVHSHLPLLHKLFGIRKEVLGITDYSIWDNSVPMVKPANVEVPYEEACKWVSESIKPLGKEYEEVLAGAYRDRWIDVYHSPGKRSGAYSGGMYSSLPYILLNHTDNLNSTFTLAHELGHSIHTYFANRNQPYSKAGYPIFLAEVASTTNEMLLHFYLYDRASSKEMKLYLLDHLFTQFRGTLYRQTQFAEFERDIHGMVEKGEPLTAQSLTEHYSKLQAQYYGPGIALNELIGYEWSRIPHFYYNFYVYKYATSFAAAQYFARKIYDGDTRTRDLYLNFLKSGGSRDPLETLIDAGVDLRTSKPIEDAFKVFSDALNEFEKTNERI